MQLVRACHPGPTIAVTAVAAGLAVATGRGPVTGALVGATALAPRWTDPLHGRLVTSIPDAGDLTFDALTQRTLAVADSVRGAGAS